MTRSKLVIYPLDREMITKLIPPKYLNLFLVIPFGLHFLFPIERVLPFSVALSGVILIPLGLFINIWSVRELQRNYTSVDFHKPTNKLVIDGPFSFSRNPIYLSGVILSFGITTLLGTLISFIFPIALVLILNSYYIPSEELKLEKTFGEEYLNYKKKVRRWI